MAYNDHSDKNSVPVPDAGVLAQIITQGDPETLVTLAEKIGRAIARQVTSSQIRNIFGTARQIQMRWPTDAAAAYRDAVLLRPKLGYYARRERGQGMANLERILSPALEEMSRAKTLEERQQRFDRFVDFFEAIVAYHKAHGGN